MVTSRAINLNNAYPVDELLDEACDAAHELPASRGPIVILCVSGSELPALIDTGSDVSCMSPETFAQVQSFLPDLTVFPVQGIRAHGAFKSRAMKVTHQFSMPFNLGNFHTTFEFLVIPGLDVPLILGVDFVRAFDVTIRSGTGGIYLEIPSDDETFSIPETSWLHAPVTASRSIRLASIRNNSIPHEIIVKPGKIVDIINSTNLHGEQRTIFANLLAQFSDIFSDRPGLTRGYEHEILLSDATPFSVAQYPIPLAHREAVTAEIDRMEQMGIISRASTPFSSPLVTTVKKDGSVRVCLDARRLNSVTLPDTELPRPIEDILMTLGPIKYVSSLDLTASYWQVPLKREHRQYTGFRVGTRSYVFNVLPFGLRTAVSSFTRCMDNILSASCSGFTHAYVDDLLVVSASFEEHMCHLEKVFKCLRQAGFTLRASKCGFFRQSIKFLGYLLDSDGLRPDPERIQGLLDFPAPRNVKAVQEFLGVANFDRVFAPNFSEVVEPLTRLLRKGSRWTWTEEQDRAFELTKATLAKQTLLWHPNTALPFFVQCDASDLGVGAMLFQVVEGKRRVLAYFSKLLLDRERRYTVSEKELLAIVLALEKWRVILLGRHFTLLTDHRALLFYLRSCRLLSPRISRWILALQEFSFDAQHISGSSNVVPDALSRHPPCRFSVPHDRSFQVTAARKMRPDLRDFLVRLPGEQQRDPFLGPIFEKLSRGELHGDFFLHHQTVFRREESDLPAVLCLPRSLLNEVIVLYHEFFGHFAAYKTWSAMRQDCWSKGLFRAVKRVLKCCEICQFSKVALLPKPQFEPIIPTAPNDLVAVDFYGPLPCSVGGVKYIFVLIDVFTKLVTLYPLKRANTIAVINRLSKDYIPKVGKPSRILCDHGTQFTANAWRNFLESQNIKLLFTSVRHPSSNPAERSMRELNRLFRTYRSVQHRGWAKDVPAFQTFLNQVVHESTGYAPCQLHFSHVPDSPLRSGLLYPPDQSNQQLDNHVRLFWAQDSLSRRALRRQRRDVRDDVVFQINDLVLLKANPVANDPVSETKKFLPIFEGPYRIERRLATKTFILVCPDSGVVRGQFHASHLRHFHSAYDSNT